MSRQPCGPTYAANSSKSVRYALMVCTEALRSCKARMNLAIAFSTVVVAGFVILLLYLPYSACCEGDAACKPCSADPAPGGYRPAWWKCRRAPELSAPYADLPHFQPYAWRNCAAACADWRAAIARTPR